MKIIETRPREIGFVLWGHCQNLLDDPRILYPEHKVSGNLGLGSRFCQWVGLGVPSLAYYVELVHFGFKHPETESKLACSRFCCFGSVL